MLNWLKSLALNTKQEDTVNIAVAGCTDIGRRRERNEDTFLLADLESQELHGETAKIESQLSRSGFLMSVADGLGGHPGGDVASRIAVKTLCDELIRNHLEPDIKTRLVQGVEVANRRVREYATHNIEAQGLATTLTTAFIRNGTAYIAHVGDTRAYLLRQGWLTQLTADQTLAQYLLDLGQLARAKAVSQHILMQAVGTETSISPSFLRVDLQQNDSLLLCSDGLFNKLSENEIIKVVNEVGDVEKATQRLIEQANSRGGEDNITMVLARFTGTGLLPAQEARNSEVSTLELPLAA
jgi:protein phosphatase